MAGEPSLSDRIRIMLGNRVPRAEIVSTLVKEGHKRTSVDPMTRRIMRGHTMPRSDYLALRRAEQTRDTVIRNLYGKQSASTIASQLGCSTNAVIGRANRLGLRARP